ncbi:MAG: O-antigen ligase family protein [Flavobacteriales bacterium]|nr:O-antigen ligase family protein [Flavobacteriales bacterium]
MLLLTAGLPSSNSLMSWGQFGMAAAWFLYGNNKLKLSRLMNQSAMWVLPFIYILFFIGMIHTEDVAEGWHILKILLPIFIIPVMLTTMPAFSNAQKSWIIHTLLGSIWICMGIGLWLYWMSPIGSINDYRKLSPFISNVRFSMLLVMGFFLSNYLFSKKGIPYRWGPSWIYLFISMGMLIYLFLLKSLTGLFVLIILIAVHLLYRLFANKSKYSVYSLIIGLVLGVFAFFKLILNEYHRYHNVKDKDFSNLPLSTRYGSIYKHDTTRWEKENGYYVWINISWYELKKAWNKRSSIDFDGFTSNGFLIRETLIHFLTSKGLRKDADGVNQLTDEEIKAIEQGIGNVNFMNPFSIRSRIYEVIKELDYYQRTRDATGKSISTRLEIWKHTLVNIYHAPFTGVGTGDVLNTMYQSYADSQTLLHPMYWMNPHNQYLYTALALGILLAFLFIILFFYPVVTYQGYLFRIYWAIVMLAMLDEDTLTTQAGATQVAFLFSFFLLSFSYKRKNV